MYMSKEEDRLKRGKRLMQDDAAADRQMDIYRQNNWLYKGQTEKQRYSAHNRFKKMHAMNCGRPNCMACGNPRKFLKGTDRRTIQEQRLEQDLD